MAEIRCLFGLARSVVIRRVDIPHGSARLNLFSFLTIGSAIAFLGYGVVAFPRALWSATSNGLVYKISV